MCVSIIRLSFRVVYRVLLLLFFFSLFGFTYQNEVEAADGFNDYFKVVQDDVKVYYNSQSGFTEVGELTNNQVYERIGSQTNWHLINFGNKIGFVKKSVTIPSTGDTINNNIGGQTTKLQIKILKDAVVLDSKSNYTEFGNLKKGMSYPVVINQLNWWGINVSGRLGFIPKSSAIPEFAPSDNYFKVTGENDVYHNTANGFEKVGSLKVGQVYQRAADRTNWHLIEFGDELGYVKKRNTEPASSQSIKNLITSPQYNGRKLVFSEDTEVLDTKNGYTSFGQAKKGLEYPIVISQSNWWGINVSGRLGFVPKKAAVEQFLESDQYFKVTDNKTDVYHKTSSGLVKVGDLSKGQEFRRLGGEEDWHLIDFGEKLGYVIKSATEPSDGNLIKNTALNSSTVTKVKIIQDATLFDNSSGSYIPISVLSKDSTYNVVREQKNFWWINIGGRVGFIYKSYATAEIINIANYDYSFVQMIDAQMVPGRAKADGNGKIDATRKEVEYYANPSNFDKGTTGYYQFLTLSKPVGLNVQEVNDKILYNKGNLKGQAQAFIEAGKKFNINEAYLLAHALHETGNGKSTLASGIPVDENGKITRNSDGEIARTKETAQTTYNMYGYGANDSCPVECGAKYAFDQGWFTPADSIIGGAQSIYSYIKRGQDTLYKMKWNPENPGYPQYATHIAWAVLQTPRIKDIYDLLDNKILEFNVPKFLNQPGKTKFSSGETSPENTSAFVEYPLKTIGQTLVDLNFREGPSTSYDSISVLKPDILFEVIGEENGWLKVKVDTNVGWISKGNQNTAYLEILNLLEVNTDDQNLNVRTGPSGEKISSLPAGELVSAKLDEENQFITVEKDGYNWYEINYENGSAWIADFIKIVK
ncbi:hypothetical protein GCM10011351_17990 [Paraliobacillus quinghaiensis]|uniref:Mannosyl-glycoprotein endo-beta-N-acetylglucosamidase-like domain-containing protein n=1 Tax=Paraliobacillus quinghaiensis TaxID=470815 RepID=A0A917WUY2_9BACI|nr:SH3 domain-containing protein [Paraliobacillus quinghaiensis]GGM32316.1 hypothetical protein GCM10011351_17990 [Paraliobacillus quinghaiensis]